MNFPQNLKKLMTDRKLSAYKMANDLHCSQTTIRNWVDGKTTPQPRTIIQLCEYFDVSEEKLLGSFPEQKNSPDIKTMPRPRSSTLYSTRCLNPVGPNILNLLASL